MVRTNKKGDQTMETPAPTAADIPEAERLKIARHLYRQQRREIEILKYKLAAYQTADRINELTKHFKKGAAAI
jgi:hypothetical protein